MSSFSIKPERKERIGYTVVVVIIYILYISVVLTLAGVRPLTLLSKHVKQSTLSTHSALEWLPALVTLIINQLENNAWTFAKHLSPMV